MDSTYLLLTSTKWKKKFQSGQQQIIMPRFIGEPYKEAGEIKIYLTAEATIFYETLSMRAENTRNISLMPRAYLCTSS